MGVAKVFGVKRQNMRFVILSLIVILLLTGVFSGVSYADDDSTGLNDLSLYKRASEMAHELGTALAPGTTKELELLKGNHNTDYLLPGNAGGFLGYADVMSDDKGVTGWFMSQFTASSAAISYDQLESLMPKEDGVFTGKKNPFFHYAGYGEALTTMGLSKSVRGGSFSLTIGRQFATGIIYVVYLIANIAPFIFKIALKILDVFNPFKLFATVFAGASAIDIGILSDVATYVGDLYEIVQGISLTIILPMLLIMTILGVLLFAKGQALKKFVRYGLTVFMVFAGLPLIGATYTGVIEQLTTSVAIGADYADYLILSSYVDFEGWARNTRLAPPDSKDITNPRVATDSETEKMRIPERDLILDINGNRADIKEARIIADRYKVSDVSDIGDIFATGSEGVTEITDKDKVNKDDKSSFRAVVDLLGRHMDGATYSGSQYDGEVSGQIQSIRDGKDHDEAIVKMYTLSENDDRSWKQKMFGEGKEWEKIYWKNANGLFTYGPAVNDEFQFEGFDYNIYNAGGLQATGSGKFYQLNSLGNGRIKPMGKNKVEAVGGLSPLAMYNFLNTTFTDTGLIVYSPDKSTSDVARDAYASVNFAAKGVTAFTRWIENFVVISSVGVLSIAFGLSMVSVAIQNIPRIVSGVFGTAFGSIAFVTKLLISTVVMIIQVLGMMFMYYISENMIVSVILNFSDFTGGVSGYFGTSGMVADFGTSFLIIIITTVFTFQMIRNMKLFRNMMEEVVSGAINRVMGLLNTSTGGKELSLADTTGGRIGSDGKVSEDASELKGVAGMLMKSHDLASQKEALGDGKDSFTDKVKSRAGIAAKLGKAGAADGLKNVVGVNGKSYKRAVGAQEAGIRGMQHSKGQDDYKDKIADDKEPVNMSNGKQVDDEGKTIKDEFGDAKDKNGNPISAEAGLCKTGIFGMGVNTKDGIIQNEKGEPYTDEAGNVFRENDAGELVDKDGNHVALDKDGILKPLEDIPDHNGKPVSAKTEAQKLDKMRTNAGAYATMKNHGSSHYGLDKDGKAADLDGNTLQYIDDNGDFADVQLDSEGFATDIHGDRLSADEIIGAVDPRGFEAVEDPITGKSHLQHKGDEAMRNLVSDDGDDVKDLESLAIEANKANMIADNANARVEDMRVNGATGYRLEQAERFAAKTANDASKAQKKFVNSMESGNANSDFKVVSDDEVKASKREVSKQSSTLKNSVNKLEEMKKSGASQKQINKQMSVIEKQRSSANNAMRLADNVETARNTGRSLSDVATASDSLIVAQKSYDDAKSKYEKAVLSGESPSDLDRRQRIMNKRSRQLSEAHDNVKRTHEKPSGTRAEIDRASANCIIAANMMKTTGKKFKHLRDSGAPSAQIEKAQRNYFEARAKNKIATQTRERLLNPVSGPVVSPKTENLTTNTISESLRVLADNGIMDYKSYSKKVKEQSNSLNKSESELRQAKSVRDQAIKERKPKQVIDAAQAKYDALDNKVKVQEYNLSALKDNAQGLLRGRGFKPAVSNRSLDVSGGVIVNKLIDMGHTQSIYDDLVKYEKSGTLTSSERRQVADLRTNLNVMKNELMGMGINENSFINGDSIDATTRHMKQSWDAFLNGTSTEYNGK